MHTALFRLIGRIAPGLHDLRHYQRADLPKDLAAGLAVAAVALPVGGIIMGIGQFIGARRGSKMVVSQGSKIIRPLLVTMSLIMSARLLWQHYAG